MIDNLLNGAMALCLPIHSLYLISGIYDLTKLQHTSINDGNILAINASQVDKLSPLKFDFKKWTHHQQLVGVNIYVAQYDSPTFQQQSLKLLKCLEANKIKAKLRLINDCDHFDIVEKLSERSFEISQDLIGNML